MFTSCRTRTSLIPGGGGGGGTHIIRIKVSRGCAAPTGDFFATKSLTMGMVLGRKSLN